MYERLVGDVPFSAKLWLQLTHPRAKRRFSKGWIKKREVSKIWTISCDNSETVRDRMSVSINRIQAFNWYRLWWIQMTLNDFERHNSPNVAFFFTEFDIFAGQLRHIGWRQTCNVCKILSPSSSLPLLAKTNPPFNAVSLWLLNYLF